MENQEEIEAGAGGIVNNGGFYDTKLSSKKKKVKLIIVLLAVVFLSATAALAARVWDPYWNPFRPSPEEIFNSAVVEMMKVDVMHSEIKLKTTIRSVVGSFGANIELISDSDGSDDSNVKLQSDFDMALTQEGIKMFLTGEIIGLGEVFYVKVDTIPLPITTSIMLVGIDLEQWRGQWIAIDPQETGISFIPDDEEVDKLEKKMAELFKKYSLLALEQEFSDEIIDGNETYHYLFKLDRDNARGFLTEMIEFQADDFDSDRIEFNEEEMDEVMELIDMFADTPIEVYIDKKELLIRKVVIKDVLEIDDEEIGLNGEIDLEMEFSGFGEPVDIVAPKDPSSVMEIFGSLITASGLPSGREKAMDARIKSALEQVRFVAEIIYSRDGDYANLCTSATSLKTTDTINGLGALQSEILNNGGSVTCYASGDDYCLSSSINVGDFWCIDDSGVSKATNSSCVSASDGCL